MPPGCSCHERGRSPSSCLSCLHRRASCRFEVYIGAPVNQQMGCLCVSAERHPFAEQRLLPRDRRIEYHGRALRSNCFHRRVLAPPKSQQRLRLQPIFEYPCRSPTSMPCFREILEMSPGPSLPESLNSSQGRFGESPRPCQLAEVADGVRKQGRPRRIKLSVSIHNQ